MNHLRLVTTNYPTRSLPSLHRRAAYRAALLLVADIDANLTSGRQHYRNRRGELLTKLDQVVAAIIAGELMTEAELHPELVEGPELLAA